VGRRIATILGLLVVAFAGYAFVRPVAATLHVGVVPATTRERRTSTT